MPLRWDPRHILGESKMRILIQRVENGPFNPLNSDAALNAAWMRRAGMISYLPCTAWAPAVASRDEQRGDQPRVLVTGEVIVVLQSEPVQWLKSVM